MTAAGEPPVPTTTGPLDEVHRAQSARLLDHLVVHGPATRSELASATGLGRGTIAGLTSRLLDAGVLRPGDTAASGDGRAAPLALAAADRVLVTAMLAPDEAIATVAALGGHELARFVEPLVDDDRGPADPLEALAIVLTRAVARAQRGAQRVADLTVLVDGAVVGRPAVVITDARIGSEPVDVLAALRSLAPAVAELEPGLSLPITLQPAAMAAALAEHAELPGIDEMLYIAGDDAVTAAAISGGRPLTGAHGLASTFAHLPVVPGGARCTCGQQGCLATVAAPELVLERAGLTDFAAAQGRAAALVELVERVAAAEDRARWSWLDAAHWIGRALQLVVPTLDPSAVIVGGYWGVLLGDVDAAFRANRPTIGGGALEAIPTLAPARLGPGAVFAGARRQARERLVAEPSLLAG
ncbi:ROK family protein [Agromyces sp. NPDC058064]|uniref:ROK family protein n=1 Tax=Agromyces sp. NPDC058064 TaxID=3346322 RepID=UPI0036D9CBF6